MGLSIDVLLSRTRYFTGRNPLLILPRYARHAWALASDSANARSANHAGCQEGLTANSAGLPGGQNQAIHVAVAVGDAEWYDIAY